MNYLIYPCWIENINMQQRTPDTKWHGDLEDSAKTFWKSPWQVHVSFQPDVPKPPSLSLQGRSQAFPGKRCFWGAFWTKLGNQFPLHLIPHSCVCLSLLWPTLFIDIEKESNCMSPWIWLSLQDAHITTSKLITWNRNKHLGFVFVLFENVTERRRSIVRSSIHRCVPQWPELSSSEGRRFC